MTMNILVMLTVHLGVLNKFCIHAALLCGITHINNLYSVRNIILMPCHFYNQNVTCLVICAWTKDGKTFVSLYDCSIGYVTSTA